MTSPRRGPPMESKAQPSSVAKRGLPAGAGLLAVVARRSWDEEQNHMIRNRIWCSSSRTRGGAGLSATAEAGRGRCAGFVAFVPRSLSSRHPPRVGDEEQNFRHGIRHVRSSSWGFLAGPLPHWGGTCVRPISGATCLSCQRRTTPEGVHPRPARPPTAPPGRHAGSGGHNAHRTEDTNMTTTPRKPPPKAIRRPPPSRQSISSTQSIRPPNPTNATSTHQPIEPDQPTRATSPRRVHFETGDDALAAFLVIKGIDWIGFDLATPADIVGLVTHALDGPADRLLPLVAAFQGGTHDEVPAAEFIKTTRHLQRLRRDQQLRVNRQAAINGDCRGED